MITEYQRVKAHQIYNPLILSVNTAGDATLNACRAFVIMGIAITFIGTVLYQSSFWQRRNTGPVLKISYGLIYLGGELRPICFHDLAVFFIKWPSAQLQSIVVFKGQPWVKIDNYSLITIKNTCWTSYLFYFSSGDQNLASKHYNVSEQIFLSF